MINLYLTLFALILPVSLNNLSSSLFLCPFQVNSKPVVPNVCFVRQRLLGSACSFPGHLPWQPFFAFVSLNFFFLKVLMRSAEYILKWHLPLLTCAGNASSRARCDPTDLPQPRHAGGSQLPRSRSAAQLLCCFSL